MIKKPLHSIYSYLNWYNSKPDTQQLKNQPLTWLMFWLQMNALQEEYRKREEELLKCRRSSQEEMLVFMEEEVGTKLSNLSNLRVRIEARLRHNHQVCKVLLLYQLHCCGAGDSRQLGWASWLLHAAILDFENLCSINWWLGIVGRLAVNNKLISAECKCIALAVCCVHFLW